ncbi:Uncharacterised protein [Vibrio cholerae]|nr:Uncharacterised protein [Vibrio cholerae]
MHRVIHDNESTINMASVYAQITQIKKPTKFGWAFTSKIKQSRE